MEWGRFLLFCVLQSVKTKETNPTRPGSPTRCKQALSYLFRTNRPIRLTQCCTQFKSPGFKIHCVLYLHHNVAFSFKCMEIPETKS